jgi:uncharacterized cupin superfamily protein
MSDVQVKGIEEVDPYSGPNALEGIKFRTVGRALGVSAWGLSVIELAPGASEYPEHDHAAEGQEEVYFVVRGWATLRTGEHERRIEEGSFVRVGPAERRKWIPGDSGVVLIAMGGTPGKAYEAR